MRRRVIGAAVGGWLLTAVPAAGQAPGQARVTAVVRTVKRTAGVGPTWKAAQLGDGLGTGDRLRTGRRSRAGMRFRDGSAMRVDEQSEVVVQSGTRDVMLRRGTMFGSYNGPGTVTSGHAVAAVRGTEFEFRRQGRAVQVRCYTGSVYVLGGGGDARAGGVDRATTTTLTDDALIGDRRDWSGRTLRIVSGPDAGQVRRIVGFDPRTGTITVDRPFSSEVGPGTDYLLSTQPDASLIILQPGMETTVHDGRPPSRPRRTFSRTFAGGQEKPWFDQVVEGAATEVIAGTDEQKAEQEQEQSLDEAVGETTKLVEKFGNTENIQGPPTKGGSAEITFPDRTSGGAEILIPTPTSTVRRTARTRSLTAARLAGAGSAIPLSVLALAARTSGSHVAAGGRVGFAWESEPFAFVGDEGDAIGVRSRMRAVSGRWMASVGARYGQFDGEGDSDLYEAFLLHRTPRWGDLKVGRQYLFLGPATNSDLGKLVGFNTMDGAFWVSPAGKKLGWQVGYVYDSAPLVGDGFSGWLGRFHGKLGAGAWGVNLLTANRAGGGLGASADVSHPIFPGRLEGYLEAGRDSFDQGLFTGGLHFPGLYQAAKVDAFLEYQSRGEFEDRVSLRLRSEFAPGWLLFGQLSKELGGDSAGGAGVQYRWRW